MERLKGLLITTVDPGSPACRAGIEAGDRILSINDYEIGDPLSYRFHSVDCRLSLLISKRDGESRKITIIKDEGEEIGLNFAQLKPTACGNKCIFCFAMQLPGGMRKSLYFKDEDYRFSFLMGNYVTLSNIRAQDIERIITERLSPLYISVHTTDEALRKKMLGNPRARNILPVIRELAGGGIEMHCQIVLCPGINDGKVLDQTISDLSEFYPHVASLAIVPVGLSRYRENLYPIKAVTRSYSKKLIARTEELQESFMRLFDYPFIFAADEFYIKGEVDFPPYDDYADFPQIENGVGMMSVFQHEAASVIERISDKTGREIKGTVITGELPSQFMKSFIKRINMISGIRMKLEVIKNRFLGPEITVTGLITGQDIINSLNGKKLGERLFIPDVMLKDDEDIFLDDVSVKDVAQALDTKVKIFRAGPEGFLRTAGIKLSRKGREH